MLGRQSLFALGCISLLQALVACSSALPGGDDRDKRVAINVVPGALPGVSDACYKLTVSNAAGKVLWTRDDVCSSRFGSPAGDISYVGPCDPASNPNRVDLVLEELTGPNGPLDIANPCPPGAPCSKTVECKPRGTTVVDYQLAVTIFDPNQGFVGVGVDLDAVYCSARLDCVADNDTDPLLILRDPVNGARVPTVVLNAACFRADGGPLFLYGSDVSVQCDGTVATLDPALGPGNLFANALAPAEVVAASTYDAPGGNPAWQSFALAVALQPGVRSCRLGAAFSPLLSPAPVAVPGGYALPAGSPVIDFDVDLSDAQGLLSCAHHTLNVTGSGISASIAGAGSRTLAHQLGSGNGCELSTDSSGSTITCRGASATIDGACSLTPFEEIVTCNGDSAVLGLGLDGAFRALTELQSRLLAFHQAHDAFPVAIAAATPGRTCCATGGVRECPANPGAWHGVEAWDLLGFSIDTAHDFVLSYVGLEPHNATVTAKTEVYCDGVNTANLVLSCSDAGGIPTCTLRLPPRQESGSCQLSSDSNGTTITCSGNFANINNSCALSSTSAGTVVSCGGASATIAPPYDFAVRRLADIQASLMSYVHQHFVLLEGAAGPTPVANSCCGPGGSDVTECPVNPDAWDQPVWDALGFSITTLQPFVYTFASVGGVARASAEGDLDCDTIVGRHTLLCTGPSASDQPMVCTLRTPALQE